MQVTPLTVTTDEIEQQTNIASYTDSSSLGILLMHDEDINLITDNTGPLAMANEYQVHYHFLNGRFTFPDESCIDVAIPTCYFNYPQEVNAAAVDFHLKDVDAVSTQLAPVANAKLNELLGTAITDKFKSILPGVDFEWIAVNLGTIHRHPGSLDSFSGTDLSTSITNPGICFPLGSVTEGEDKPSFSSIILHKGSRSVIGHSEYRLASQNANTVSYFKGRCLTFVHGDDIMPSDVEKLLGVPVEQTKYNTADNVKNIPAFAQAFYECFAALDFHASTEFIYDTHVKVKVYTPVHSTYKPYSAGYATSKKTVPHHTTVEYKDIASIIEVTHDITLKQYHELYQMSQANVLKYYNELELVQSYRPAIHTEFTSTTIIDIVALQNELWLETFDLNDDDEEETNSYLSKFFTN